MPKQLVPDTARFRLVWRNNAGNVEMLTQLYVRDTVNPWTVAHLNQIRELIANWVDGELKAHMSTQLTLLRIECEDLGADPGNQHVVVQNLVGTDAGPPLTTAAATLVSIRCASGGTPKRGRIFLPVGTEDDLSTNTWISGHVTGVQQAMEALQDDVSLSIPGAFEGLVIVSRYENGVERPEGVTNVWDSIVVRPLVGIQRRRRT